MAFRLNDKMVLPDLLELADRDQFNKIVERFGDEGTPFDKRLQRILESL